jgi:hypothetical protein
MTSVRFGFSLARWRASGFYPPGMRPKPFLSTEASPSKRRLLKPPSLCSIRKPIPPSDPANDKSGAAAVRSKARARPRDRKIFCPLPWQKIPDPPFDPGRRARPHALPQGGTETEGDPPAPPSSSFKIKNYKSFLVVVVAGGYVGEGEHFPVFAQQNGGSAAVRLKADRPHIHGQFRRNRGRGVQL